MPESTDHRDAVDLLKLILLAFVARTGRNARVVANLACRWDKEHPSVGVDPDIALIEPAPPTSGLSSLRTWEEGQPPPRFAVEVVSATNPHKDYVQAPAKYAVLGARELVIFDPSLFGPKGVDGPHVLQVWRLADDRPTMVREHAGSGPAYSAEMEAWLVVTPQGFLRLADDPEGLSLWNTEAETEALGRRKEAEGRRKEVEGRRKEAEGRRLALRQGIEDICDLCGVPLDKARKEHLAELDVPGLDALRVYLKEHHAWPERPRSVE